MSPGNQIRAVTATRATPNKATIRAGNKVERMKFNACEDFRSFCLPSQDLVVDHATPIRLRSQPRVKGSTQTTVTTKPIQPPSC